MNIRFILPGNDDRPYGGYRVAYEYASRLQARGHDVSIAFPAIRRIGEATRAPLAAAGSLLSRVLPTPGTTVTWFELAEKIRLLRPLVLTAHDLLDCDVVVATAWDTAEDLGRVLPGGVAGVYLIQSDETWAGPQDRVAATWRLPFTRIVIASWLEDLAAARSALPVQRIPNAVDAEVFSSVTPLETRSNSQLAMLWHPDHVKGSDVGLAALELVREQRSGTRASLFGFLPRPERLPGWVSYTQLPSRTELAAMLNTAAIFISPSRLEGFGLPPIEAMACGAALVATDIGGHRDYCIHDQTALVVPSEDPASLAAAVISLIDDPGRRHRLAAAGTAIVLASFSWSHSTDLMESALIGACDAAAAAGRQPGRAARRRKDR